QAQNDSKDIPTTRKEKSQRLFATPDRSFLREYVEAVTLARTHFAPTGVTEIVDEKSNYVAPREQKKVVAYYESAFFLFSSPLTDAKNYYIARTLAFPKSKALQPLRAETINSLISRYGTPTFSLLCRDTTGTQQRKRVLAYFYKQ